MPIKHEHLRFASCKISFCSKYADWSEENLSKKSQILQPSEWAALSVEFTHMISFEHPRQRKNSKWTANYQWIVVVRTHISSDARVNCVFEFISLWRMRHRTQLHTALDWWFIYLPSAMCACVRLWCVSHTIFGNDLFLFRSEFSAHSARWNVSVFRRAFSFRH